jgi:hypothetical protein
MVAVAALSVAIGIDLTPQPAHAQFRGLAAGILGAAIGGMMMRGPHYPTHSYAAPRPRAPRYSGSGRSSGGGGAAPAEDTSASADSGDQRGSKVLATLAGAAPPPPEERPEPE